MYKLSCKTRSFTYIGESKRKGKFWRTEHKPETNGNVGSTIEQPAETAGKDIHPECASILETGVQKRNKKQFLESLHFIPVQELC